MNMMTNYLEDYLKVSFTIEKITNKTYLIRTAINELFIIKLNEKNNTNIFNLLKSKHTPNVLYPLKIFKIMPYVYELYPYVENIKYKSSQKVLNLKNAIINLHKSTIETKVIGKKHLDYMYNIYKILDDKFMLLEVIMQEIEKNTTRTDFDWLYLSKYHLYLDVKKEMYNLQKKINQYIEGNNSITYSLNHGYPSIQHLINTKLVSFNYAKMAIPVSDIARFYVLNDHINIDWFKEIDEWLNLHNNKFYKTYFKFLVYYIYLINLDFTKTSLESHFQSFTNITKKIKIFSTYFYNY